MITTEAAVSPGFALATANDDAEVRALLRRSVLPGAVNVAFTREPNYFAGEGLAGARDHTVVHRREGVLDGVARLSIHTLQRNQHPATIGYLGELRIAPNAAHSAQMLRDGYTCLHELVQTNHVDACFTSIAADNTRARRVLEHGQRFGLPVYTPLADLVTVLIPVRRARHAVAEGAQAPHEDELTEFLQRHAIAAQLTLTWDAARWAQLAEHGITPAAFRVVRARGRSGPIVAAGAVWDQRAFKQTVVVGYDGALRVGRPMVNALALTGVVPSLPTPGAVLAQAAILGLSASDALPGNLHALLRLLQADAAQRGLDWLVVARETRDPQLAALRAAARDVSRLRTRAREYHTRLYEVHWPDASVREPWDTTPFRPEVALL